MLLALAVLAALPPNGAEHRQLQCRGGTTAVVLEVVRFTVTDGGTVLEHLRAERVVGEPDAPASPFDERPVRKKKPDPGCKFAMPGPKEEWKLEPVASWTAPALKCKAKTVSASVGATGLAVKKGKSCGDDDAFVLEGGSRKPTPVLQCTFQPKDAESMTLTFGPVERIWSQHDCFEGEDFRATTP